MSDRDDKKKYTPFAGTILSWYRATFGRPSSGEEQQLPALPSTTEEQQLPLSSTTLTRAGEREVRPGAVSVPGFGSSSSAASIESYSEDSELIAGGGNPEALLREFSAVLVDDAARREREARVQELHELREVLSQTVDAEPVNVTADFGDGETTETSPHEKNGIWSCIRSRRGILLGAIVATLLVAAIVTGVLVRASVSSGDSDDGGESTSPTQSPSSLNPNPSLATTPAPNTPEGTPTHSPSPSLNEDCLLTEIQCVAGAVGRFPGFDCSSWRPEVLSVQQCEYTPFVAEFLFNGGSCSQSDNQALLNFTCSD
jgi:hypothetical protein